MDLKGSIVFNISNEKLDFVEIENNLHIKPTRIMEKDQFINDYKECKVSSDRWSYKIKIEDSVDLCNDLLKFLEIFSPHLNYIKKLSLENENVSIDFYISSLYGQMGFTLNKKIIKKLLVFELPLNFHILSFGDVKE
ncbi:MAG: DUF4279 domain-containing protein [Firmicutes bacterium]|nr:DUF4279 domain-containing protein [Bacillota bacterium]